MRAAPLKARPCHSCSRGVLGWSEYGARPSLRKFLRDRRYRIVGGGLRHPTDGRTEVGGRRLIRVSAPWTRSAWRARDPKIQAWRLCKMTATKLTFLALLLLCATWVVAQSAPAGGTAPAGGSSASQAQTPGTSTTPGNETNPGTPSTVPNSTSPNTTSPNSNTPSNSTNSTTSGTSTNNNNNKNGQPCDTMPGEPGTPSGSATNPGSTDSGSSSPSTGTSAAGTPCPK